METKLQTTDYENYRTLAPIPNSITEMRKPQISIPKVVAPPKGNNVLSRQYRQKLSLTDNNLYQKISEITFSDSKQTLSTHFRDKIYAFEDISENNDGSVIGCVERIPQNDSYILHISANGKVCAPTNSSHLFEDFAALTDIEFDNAFDTKNVADMSNMFAGCSQLQNLDVTTFDTRNVTDMQFMFYNCSNLQTLDTSSFDTRKVTNMRAMFYCCSNLQTLNIRSLNTVNVTDMQFMFYDCHSLPTLDVRSFDTHKVTNMQAMFCFCLRLQTVDVSRFDTKNVSDMRDMFTSCLSLQNIAEIAKHLNAHEDIFTGCNLTAADKLYFLKNKITQFSKKKA